MRLKMILLNKKVMPLLILVVAVGIVAIMMMTRRQLEPRQVQAPPIAVRVVEVYPGNVQLVVHAQGTVSPRTESSLVPEVSGNVTWVSPNLVSGGYFEKGAALLKVDDRDYRDAVQRAEATLQRAEAEHNLAQFEYERANDLYSRDLISRIDLESKLRTSRVTAASLEDAQLQLDTAKRDLARTTLKAPFSGLVRSEQIDVGQFINRGSAVATVYASDYVEVRLPVADQQLAYLNVPLTQRGELDDANAPAVHLTAEFAGKTQAWDGKIVRTEGEIDPGSRMVYVIARVRAAQDRSTQDKDQLPPPVGLFVQAEIEGLAVDNMVVLPRSALRNENQVLIVDADDRLRFRDVDVLRVYRDEVYISDGISPGERVCVSTLQTVVEGMHVQPLLVEQQHSTETGPSNESTTDNNDNGVVELAGDDHDAATAAADPESVQSGPVAKSQTPQQNVVTETALAQKPPPPEPKFREPSYNPPTLAEPEYEEPVLDTPQTTVPLVDKPELEAAASDSR